MFDLIFAMIFGTLSGVFIGLLPGFGISTCLLLFSPFLIQQSLVFCLLFYCCASSASQYFGSVTTLSLRIPGETTSLPLLEIMKNNDFSRRIGDIYFLTSFGSLFASLISAALIIFFYSYFLSFIDYLKTYMMFVFCILGFFLCVFFSENKIFTSLFLFTFGWTISKIGYDSVQNINFLTFDNVYLYGGIPSLPVIMGAYAIPSLIKMFSYVKNVEKTTSQVLLTKSKMFLIIENYKTILISSFIGFVMGLIPYLGSGMSSYIGYFLDKKRKKNDFVSNAVASETANNSANLSVLIPLVFLGIAIIPSEFLLLELLPLGNKALTFIDIQPYLIMMFFLLLFSNIFCFYLSWNFVQFMLKLVSKLNYFFPIILIIGIVFSIFYIGNNYNQALYYLIIFVFFGIFGIYFSNKDLLPFVYAFMLQNNFENVLYRMMIIYL
jgi:putative tricarboxylic transport membrane protein